MRPGLPDTHCPSEQVAESQVEHLEDDETNDWTRLGLRGPSPSPSPSPHPKKISPLVIPGHLHIVVALLRMSMDLRN